MSRLALYAMIVVTGLLSTPRPASAQGATAPPPPPTTQELDLDLRPVPAEPDFTLGALPTTLRMPAGKGVFRMTHRFTRPIADGSAGDFFSDFFGFDSASRVGIEVRYGFRPGTQGAIHRTNDRTIQLSAQHEFVAQSDTQWFALHGVAALEGRNNFGLSDEIAVPDADVFTMTLGSVLSRRVGTQGAIYLEPLLVLNSNVDPVRIDDDNHSLLIGVGGRWRLGQAQVYLFGEVAPRAVGYSPGSEHVSLGIEKRMGGHIFQFNISNSLGTTMGQLARGGPDGNDWFIGFNLSRKFY
jgi:hypothetical protein